MSTWKLTEHLTQCIKILPYFYGLAVILQQFNYWQNSFIVSIPVWMSLKSFPGCDRDRRLEASCPRFESHDRSCPGNGTKELNSAKTWTENPSLKSCNILTTRLECVFEVWGETFFEEAFQRRNFWT